MKTLYIISLCLICLSGAAQVSPKKDSVQQMDTIQQWKADSARLSNSSPVRMNNPKNQSYWKPSATTPAGKVNSSYTYDANGNITGGSTRWELKKKKKD